MLNNYITNRNIEYSVLDVDAINSYGITNYAITYYYEDSGFTVSERFYCSIQDLDVQVLQNENASLYTFTIKLLPNCSNSSNYPTLKRIYVEIYSGAYKSIEVTYIHQNFAGNLIINEFYLEIAVKITTIQETQNQSALNIRVTKFNFVDLDPYRNYPSDLYYIYHASNISSLYYNASTANSTVGNKTLRLKHKETYYKPKWFFYLKNKHTFSFSDIVNNQRRDVMFLGYQDRVFVHNRINNTDVLNGYVNKNFYINTLATNENFFSNSTGIPLSMRNVGTSMLVAYILSIQNNNIVIYSGGAILHHRDGTDYPNYALNVTSTNADIDNDNIVLKSRAYPVIYSSGFMGERFFNQLVIETMKGFNCVELPKPNSERSVQMLTPFMGFEYNSDFRRISVFYRRMPVMSKTDNFLLSNRVISAVINLDIDESKNVIIIFGLDYDKVCLFILPDEFYFIYLGTGGVLNKTKLNSLIAKQIGINPVLYLSRLLGYGGGYALLRRPEALTVNFTDRDSIAAAVWYKLIQHRLGAYLLYNVLKNDF